VNKKDSPLEKLNEFIKFHFSFLEKNKQMTSVIFAEEIFTQSNILKEKLLKILKHRKMLIVDIIESAKSDNKIKEVDSTELSKIIIGTIRMSVLEWKLGNFSYSLIESGNKIIKNLEKLIFN
ncbi:MAG: TetR family transcriptional regulator C-terminal domain-containing protein, partial [Ignavibacteriae bacterium]|nr:TetR family transcriptional regulator C-terminal domain-containing protein [Ignavibacteriota bacterium]